VSPHKVILDADIDHFGHPDAGHALMSAAANYPEEAPSADDSASEIGCDSLGCGVTNM
jgi:hypothetical protein